jgi:hypothetical protein
LDESEEASLLCATLTPLKVEQEIENQESNTTLKT